MPEPPLSPIRPHPLKRPLPAAPTASGPSAATPSPSPRPRTARYAELHTTTNFTFLTGASDPAEMVQRAAELGLAGLAITDVNTLAGVVRAHVAAKQVGLPLAIGARLELAWPDGDALADPAGPASPDASPLHARPPLSLLIYPTSPAGYAGLCRMLTLGKRRAEKGRCRLTWADLLDHHDGLLAAFVPPPPPHPLDRSVLDVLLGLAQVFTGDRLSLAATFTCDPDDPRRLHQLADLARYTNLPLLAVGDARAHDPARRPLQDVLTCIRMRLTLDQAGLALTANAERRLHRPDTLAQRFAHHPRALDRGLDLLERTRDFSLDQLRYQYPDELHPDRPGLTPMRHLVELTRAGAATRYPDGVPQDVQRQIDHELLLIDELGYAPYFLTVHDIVRFARGRGILCQGRGAAANSAVCYCLDVTAVDPARVNVLFERFVSRERNEPPDIDIDFEHERREEVIQYVYRKYGRDRAALCAEVITYRGRSAIREVGGALGLSRDCVDRLAKHLDWWAPAVPEPKQLRDLGLDPNDRTIHWLVELAREIQGFPRHLSQHVGGFVITRDPLCEMVPIENAAMPDRTVIEWDKDDIDAMGMLKVDLLGLGMLTAVRKTIQLGRDFQRAQPDAARTMGPTMPAELTDIPPEDPVVYDMLGDADTIGVFQIESRAQMSMLPRLRPRRYYDLVIEVAIVRPGPIQGQMVHPYLRRRNGEEPVTFPDEAVRAVLQRTLGVPLFQEQAMSLAIVAAGFSPDEADQLRRAIAAWKTKRNVIFEFGQRLVDGMIARGYDPDFAHRCFEQIKGFSEYGFPESHAASFALIVYVSAWLKRHHPAAFLAGLINSQPMGFYAPSQLVRDAQAHGVEVRPIDVNHSTWDCTLELPADDPPHAGADPRPDPELRGVTGANPIAASPHRPPRSPAIRLGMRLVKGLPREDAERLIQTVARLRAAGSPTSIEALHRAGVTARALRRLAAADAFNSIGLDRQTARWRLAALTDAPAPLFDDLADPDDAPDAPRPALPAVTETRHVLQDYAAATLSLRRHPMHFLRDSLDARRVTVHQRLQDPTDMPHGAPIAVAGVVLVRQRPGPAHGILFMTLEDETGVANLIVRPRIMERYPAACRHSLAVLARGRVERQGKVVHVMVHRLEDISHELALTHSLSRNFR